ncbi:MAG: hypothetical protein ABSA58_15490, partial [Acetobacteraceae bacterium]
MKRSKGFFWANVDFYVTLSVLFMALSCLAVAAKSPPEDAGTRFGNLTIEMQWPVGSPSDLDLWVQPPGDRPIGYSRKTGKSCDLVRDDLGAEHDEASRAMEVVVCRQAIAGEYIVNVHAYRFQEPSAIPVRLLVHGLRPESNSIQTLLTRSITVDHMGQEVTAVRFTIGADGQIDQDSINNLQKNLRA